MGTQNQKPEVGSDFQGCFNRLLINVLFSLKISQAVGMPFAISGKGIQ